MSLLVFIEADYVKEHMLVNDITLLMWYSHLSYSLIVKHASL